MSRVGRAFEDDLAFVHQGHVVKAAGLVQVGGGDEGGDLLGVDELGQDEPEVAPRDRIDAGGGARRG
jgi:hypothetical protein